MTEHVLLELGVVRLLRGEESHLVENERGSRLSQTVDEGVSIGFRILLKTLGLRARVGMLIAHFHLLESRGQLLDQQCDLHAEVRVLRFVAQLAVCEADFAHHDVDLVNEGNGWAEVFLQPCSHVTAYQTVFSSTLHVAVLGLKAEHELLTLASYLGV